MQSGQLKQMKTEWQIHMNGFLNMVSQNKARQHGIQGREGGDRPDRVQTCNSGLGAAVGLPALALHQTTPVVMVFGQDRNAHKGMYKNYESLILTNT